MKRGSSPISDISGNHALLIQVELVVLSSCLVRMARSGPANKNDWKTEPMPEKCTIIELNQEYSRDRMETIKNGLIPEEMEDKWFIYYESSENKLYLHRSWTGYCIYIIRFEEREDKFVATTAEVNREPSQYSCTDDDEDKITACFLIDSFLY